MWGNLWVSRCLWIGRYMRLVTRDVGKVCLMGWRWLRRGRGVFLSPHLLFFHLPERYLDVRAWVCVAVASRAYLPEVVFNKHKCERQEDRKENDSEAETERKQGTVSGHCHHYHSWSPANCATVRDRSRWSHNAFHTKAPFVILTLNKTLLCPGRHSCI